MIDTFNAVRSAAIAASLSGDRPSIKSSSNGCAFNNAELGLPVVALTSFGVEGTVGTDQRENGKVSRNGRRPHISSVVNANGSRVDLPMIPGTNNIDLSKIGPEELLQLAQVVDSQPQHAKNGKSDLSKQRQLPPARSGRPESDHKTKMQDRLGSVGPLPEPGQYGNRQALIEQALLELLSRRDSSISSSKALLLTAVGAGLGILATVGVKPLIDDDPPPPTPSVVSQSRSWSSADIPQQPAFPSDLNFQLTGPDGGIPVFAIATAVSTAIATATPGVVPTSTALPPSCEATPQPTGPCV